MSLVLDAWILCRIKLMEMQTPVLNGQFTFLSEQTWFTGSAPGQGLGLLAGGCLDPFAQVGILMQTKSSRFPVSGKDNECVMELRGIIHLNSGYRSKAQAEISIPDAETRTLINLQIPQPCL